MPGFFSRGKLLPGLLQTPGWLMTNAMVLAPAAAITVIWLISAWLIAAQLAHWRGQEQLNANEKQAQQSVQGIVQDMQHTLTVLQSIPVAIAQDDGLALTFKQLSQRKDVDSPHHVRNAWQNDNALRAINKKIAALQRSIGALSVVWVMDTHGYTWLTSNAGMQDSLLGNNYSDRQYFMEALEGYNGRQFAFGRSTRSPGLFFASPILVEDQVVGVVAAKLEMSYLASAIEQVNSFISDENGVIILARDKSYEMRTLPDANVRRLSQTDRKNSYHRIDFAPLALSSWGDSRFPALSRVDEQTTPYLFKLREVPYQNIRIGVLQPVPEINRIASDQWVFFLLLAVTGSLVIGGVAVTAIYLSNSSQSRQAISSRNNEIQQRNELLQKIVQGHDIEEILPLIAKFTQNQFIDGQCLIYLLASDGDHLKLAAAPSIPASFHHRFSGYQLSVADNPWHGNLEEFNQLSCDENSTNALCISLGKLLTGSPRSSLWSVPFRDQNGKLLGILSLGLASPGVAQEAQRNLLIACARLAALAIMHNQNNLDLVRARNSAEEANQNQSNFISNMGHEIRTPMNGVLDMISLLLKTKLGPDQKDYADSAHGSALTLLGVLDDILDYAQIEAGELNIERIDFDLGSLVHDLDQQCMPLATAKKIEYCPLIPPDLPQLLHGDPRRLRQVLLNLISNAIKFTATGTVSYGIEFISSSEKSVCLRFSVTDTGIGIPSDKLGLLFSPFIETRQNVTHDFGSTGLGLAICKRLVELMGGTIGVESAENTGSRFWFVLPLELQHDTPLVLPTEPSSSKARQRILVVEDNPINQRLAVTLLKREGYEVEMAQDGLDALKLLAKRDFDLVLMDCRMPNMDGYTATRAIRNAERGVRNPAITIIAMTANAMTGDAELVLAAGMNGYLTKPISPKKLNETLQQWLVQVESSADDNK